MAEESPWDLATMVALPEHVCKGGEDENPRHTEHRAEQDGHHYEHPVPPEQNKLWGVKKYIVLATRKMQLVCHKQRGIIIFTFCNM